MDWICKGMLTAAAVGALLFAARRVGHCAAGWLAGLPVTTAPMLAWLATDHGTAMAADAAVAGVAACGVLALVALAVALTLAQRRQAAAAAALSALASALALPWLAARGGLPGGVAAAACGCALALQCWPKVHRLPLPSASSWRAAVGTSAAAGALSVLASAAGPALGMAAAGWLAALPVVTASVAVAEAAQGGRAAVLPFLHGYVLGLIGRTAFGASFVIALDHTSLAVALGSACAVAVACHLLVAAAAAGLARARALYAIGPAEFIRSQRVTSAADQAKVGATVIVATPSLLTAQLWLAAGRRGK